MDTDEEMMMVWIYVEEHLFGLKIILISISGGYKGGYWGYLPP